MERSNLITYAKVLVHEVELAVFLLSTSSCEIFNDDVHSNSELLIKLRDVISKLVEVEDCPADV